MFSKELLKTWYLGLRNSTLLLNLIPAYMGNDMHALSCPLLLYLIKNKTYISTILYFVLQVYCILYVWSPKWFCFWPLSLQKCPCHLQRLPKWNRALFRMGKSGTLSDLSYWKHGAVGNSGMTVRIREICSPVALREFWAQFSAFSTIKYLKFTHLVKIFVHERYCALQSLKASASLVLQWRLYPVIYICVSQLSF